VFAEIAISLPHRNVTIEFCMELICSTDTR
jgi:hypothetical protein